MDPWRIRFWLHGVDFAWVCERLLVWNRHFQEIMLEFLSDWWLGPPIRETLMAQFSSCVAYSMATQSFRARIVIRGYEQRSHINLSITFWPWFCKVGWALKSDRITKRTASTQIWTHWLSISGWVRVSQMSVTPSLLLLFSSHGSTIIMARSRSPTQRKMFGQEGIRKNERQSCRSNPAYPKHSGLER